MNEMKNKESGTKCDNNESDSETIISSFMLRNLGFFTTIKQDAVESQTILPYKLG